MALGMAAAGFGVLPFVGVYRRFFRLFWATGIWNRRPSATVAMVPIGCGVILVGISMLTGRESLLLASVAAMAAGAAIYIADPAWLRPGWTRPTRSSDAAVKDVD